MKKYIYILLISAVITTSVFALTYSIPEGLKKDINLQISEYIPDYDLPFMKRVGEVRANPKYYDPEFLSEASDEDVLIIFPTENTKGLLYSPTTHKVIKFGNYNYYSRKEDFERILSLLSKQVDLPKDEYPIVGRISEEDWGVIAEDEGEEFRAKVNPGDWLISYPVTGVGYIYREESDEIVVEVK